MRIEVHEDAKAVGRAAAALAVNAAARAVASRGSFTLALAGGDTPLGAYALLGSPPLSRSVPWGRVHLFWGDERAVDPDSPYSNQRAALEALGPPPGLPLANLHPIQAGKGAERGAAHYEAHLRGFFGQGRFPEFDLIFLGLGADGHTASLFPGCPALDERKAWATAVEPPGGAMPNLARISLTLPVINAARKIVFLAEGKEKARAVRRVIDDKDARAPAAMVRPKGELTWLLDEQAAMELKR